MALPHLSALSTDFVCGTARFIIPMRALVERGLCTADIGYVNVPGARLSVSPGNVVLLQRNANMGQGMQAQLRGVGCRIIHDIDDLLWDIPPDNPAYRVMDAAAQAQMIGAMREADLVTTSTEPLRNELARLGIAATVLPNVLDPNEWAHLRIPRAPHPKPRVGWYGQVNVHVGDLAVINEVVRALIDQVQFVFFGDLPPNMADLAPRLEFVPQVALPFFPATLARLDLDLMLAPLAENRFNEAKSNLRLLYAGMLGYPVVASDVVAHRGLPAKLVPNAAPLWVEAIRERLADPGAAWREGAALHEAVLANFVTERWIGPYYQTWTGRVLEAAPSRSAAIKLEA